MYKKKAQQIRYWLFSLVLVLSADTHAQSQIITENTESLYWMVGSWKGSLGEQTVEETWSTPQMGSMDTMIRLSSPEGVQMIELIVIREVTVSKEKKTLALFLRQFSPDLELRATQDMLLQDISTQSVSFFSEASSGIKQLSYTLLAPDQLTVDVTTVTGGVFSVNLQSKSEVLPE